MHAGTTILLGTHDLQEADCRTDQALRFRTQPTRVAEILQYGDARPRTVATLSEPGFVVAKKLSVEIFRREARR